MTTVARLGLRGAIATGLVAVMVQAVAFEPPVFAQQDQGQSWRGGGNSGHRQIRDEDLAPPGFGDEADGIERDDEHWDDDGEGRPRQVVKLFNRTDGRLRVRGKVEINTIRGNQVIPLNLAEAKGTCVDCQTFAVALQVNVYRRGADNVSPINRGIALNEHCTRCITVARAIQYVVPADDPEEVPERAEHLIHELERELRDVHRDSNHITAAEANRRIQTVIDQFNDLGQDLLTATAVQEAENGDDDSERSPGPRSISTPEPTQETAATATPSPTATVAESTPTATPDVTATPTPSATPVIP